MDERYEEAVFIQAGIDSYDVQALLVTAVIAMTCNALIDYFQVNPIEFYQLKNSVERMFGQVWCKDMLHVKST